jgi:hypothetical protein
MHGVRIFGIVLLSAAGALFAQPSPGANAPAPGNTAGPKSAASPAPRLVNPESVAALLMRATPDQRERALQRFPPERQAQLRKQLAWFDGLPKAQQEIQLERLERFASLPPDKQLLVRQQMQHLNQMPPARSRLIRQALALLQSLPPDERAVRMNRPAFRQRFSPEELQIIVDLADAWLLPPF